MDLMISRRGARFRAALDGGIESGHDWSYMVTEVRIAELKAHLSDYLRSVRRGNEVIVKDRETPVARIVPLPARGASFVTRSATRTFQEVEDLLASRPRKRIKMKPGTLEKAIRETKRDRLDPWTQRKSTSTRR